MVRGKNYVLTFVCGFAHAPTRSIITLLYSNGVSRYSLNVDRIRILSDTPIDPLNDKLSDCLLGSVYTKTVLN